MRRLVFNFKNCETSDTIHVHVHVHVSVEQ